LRLPKTPRLLAIISPPLLIESLWHRLKHRVGVCVAQSQGEPKGERPGWL
jgi:hypothetical protein